MSDDGYGGGGAGDDYDYGGPSLAEEVYVRPIISHMHSFSHIRLG